MYGSTKRFQTNWLQQKEIYCQYNCLFTILEEMRKMENPWQTLDKESILKFFEKIKEVLEWKLLFVQEETQSNAQEILAYHKETQDPNEFLNGEQRLIILGTTFILWMVKQWYNFCKENQNTE